MSTYRSTFRVQKDASRLGLTSWVIFSVSSGLLIALMSMQLALILSPSAFAFATDSQPPQDITRAGVSVVRLIVSYSSPPAATSAPVLAPTQGPSALSPTITCTGLGVLVASWMAQTATEQNAWVLTDGTLVNPTSPACAGSNVSTPLSSIRIILSTAYGSNTFFTTTAAMVHCSPLGSPPCNNVPGLVSFHSDVLLPFVNVAAHQSTPNVLLQLTQSATSASIPSPSSTTDAKQVAVYQQYLTPFRVVPNGPNSLLTGPNLEIGTPIVNDGGKLMGMVLAGRTATTLVTLGDLNDLLTQQKLVGNLLFHPNVVDENWDKGITTYYAGDTATANSAFQLAAQANPQFQGAQNLVKLTTMGHTQNSNTASRGDQLASPLYIALMVLVALLLVVGLGMLVIWFRRLRRRQAVKREMAEVDSSATREAQRIKHLEMAQTQQILPQQPSVHVPTPPVESSDPTVQLPRRSTTEHPTVVMGHPRQQDSEKTMSYGMPRVQKHPGLVVAKCTDPGLKRKHKPNEDSYLAEQAERRTNTSMQQVGLFVVADGMGGHANGQDASRLAIKTIEEYIMPRLSKDGEASDEAFTQLLVEGVQQANQAVHQHNVDQHADMGTTITAALVAGMMAYVANVGDSRTYLYRESDGLSKITKDHSVVASLVEAGIIEPDDIYTHPKRNQIYRSLGEKSVVEVDPFTVPLQVGDMLLLCSDGLWDMVRDPKIAEVLKNPVPDLKTTGEALIQAALDGGGEDNVSVIVVKVAEKAKPSTTTRLVDDTYKTDTAPPQ